MFLLVRVQQPNEKVKTKKYLTNARWLVSIVINQGGVRMELTQDRPIFQQIAETIEDGILTGSFDEEEQVPSITEFSVMYKINPATANKGINLLVDEGILYKKRGVGMFVSTGAVTKLKEKRQTQFYDNYISRLIKEAKKLNISSVDIIAMIERGYGHE